MKVIVLSGDLGSGKSTVAKLIAPKLDAKIHSTGQIMRRLAEEKGIPFVEFSKYAETHHEIDHQIDDATVELCANAKTPLLIDSRMAWHFVKGAFSVYMMVKNVEAARRIMAANRPEEAYQTLSDAAAKITDRRRSEKKRYLELYGVKLDDLNNYDYVIDTTCLTPEEVCSKIVAAFEAFQARPVKRIEICPDSVEVREKDGDEIIIAGEQDAYYTISGGNKVLQAVKDGEKLIACAYKEI